MNEWLVSSLCSGNAGSVTCNACVQRPYFLTRTSTKNNFERVSIFDRKGALRFEVTFENGFNVMLGWTFAYTVGNILGLGLIIIRLKCQLTNPFQINAYLSYIQAVRDHISKILSKNKIKTVLKVPHRSEEERSARSSLRTWFKSESQEVWTRIGIFKQILNLW